MHKHVAISFLIAPFFLLTGAVGTNASHADDAAKVRFNRDIRPILSQACFRCHGFDEKTREAGLRLDTREGATASQAGHRAPIAPGDLGGSEAWSRIVSEDPDLVMPPKESNRQLTDAEKELIKRWIEQGAEYENHWSFEPIPPKANELEIDRYLEKEIAAAGIGVNQQADPITLVRRAAFTLTGLPPSAEQVERLVQNPNQVEYAKLVDELLSSPHYGEEMAKHWLDVARYGDTHGLHLDNERTMWAYRDWVIQAFNKNLPYDQFTIEQLAGDLLPSPTQEQLVATGFNRCNVTTSEGGAINEEFLYRYAVDRTSTTVQAWLGLTGGCAVCHDHKYDPLTTKEFYSLYSFFYSAADPAMDGNIHNTQPFLKLTSPEQKAKLDELRAKESRLRKELLEIANDPVRRADLQVSKLTAKEVSASPVTTWRTEVWINDLMPAGGSIRNTSRNEETWISNKDAPMGERYIRQTFGDKFEQFISGGWIAKDVPKDGTFSFWVRPDRYEAPEAIYVMLKVDNKSYRWVWANSPEQGRLLGGNEKSIVGPMPKPGVWTQLTIPLSELSATASLQELQFGLFGGVADWDGFVCSGRHESIATEEPWKSWWKKQSGRSLPLVDGDLSKAIKEGPESEAGKQKESEVAAYFYAYIGDEISNELLQKRGEWEETRVSIASLESEIPGTFIFKDEASPRQAHVMTRGQYDQKGEPVEPSTPAFLPPLPKAENNARPTRLDLAKWLVAKNNPLTARVAVNRLWQQVFGVGLVKTSDDFGTQGAPPSHPELLDALAADFVDSGWDMKRLMKNLLLTQAFQRSAIVSDEALKTDPENRLLARGPRIRLDAEQIRDNVLASAGILNRGLGGVGFKGYQPPGIWEPVGYGDSNTRYYVQDHGGDIYRRSVYAFFKRTAPPPFMSNFDAPNREQFCSRRERSNTPLQALQLMNDIQYIEAARHLAENVIQRNLGSDQERIQVVMKQSLSRDCTESELARLQSAYDSFKQRFRDSPDDAERLLKVGESPANPKLDRGEVAALCLVVNLVFNLDEFVNRN
jgi:hypothetical protein